MKFKTQLSLFFLLFLNINLFATHNQAGNILVNQIGEKTIHAKIITYTTAGTIAILQRDSLQLCLGDGHCEFVERNIKYVVANDILYSEYNFEYEYVDFGTYTLSMADPNRTAGIINMAVSPNIPFYIETTFVVSAGFKQYTHYFGRPHDIRPFQAFRLFIFRMPSTKRATALPMNWSLQWKLLEPL